MRWAILTIRDLTNFLFQKYDNILQSEYIKFDGNKDIITRYLDTFNVENLVYTETKEQISLENFEKVVLSACTSIHNYSKLTTLNELFHYVKANGFAGLSYSWDNFINSVRTKIPQKWVENLNIISPIVYGIQSSDLIDTDEYYEPLYYELLSDKTFFYLAIKDFLFETANEFAINGDRTHYLYSIIIKNISEVKLDFAFGTTAYVKIDPEVEGYTLGINPVFILLNSLYSSLLTGEYVSIQSSLRMILCHELSHMLLSHIYSSNKTQLLINNTNIKVPLQEAQCNDLVLLSENNKLHMGIYNNFKFYLKRLGVAEDKEILYPFWYYERDKKDLMLYLAPISYHDYNSDKMIYMINQLVYDVKKIVHSYIDPNFNDTDDIKNTLYKKLKLTRSFFDSYILTIFLLKILIQNDTNNENNDSNGNYGNPITGSISDCSNVIEDLNEANKNPNPTQDKSAIDKYLSDIMQEAEIYSGQSDDETVATPTKLPDVVTEVTDLSYCLYQFTKWLTKIKDVYNPTSRSRTIKGLWGRDDEMPISNISDSVLLILDVSGSMNLFMPKVFSSIVQLMTLIRLQNLGKKISIAGASTELYLGPVIVPTLDNLVNSYNEIIKNARGGTIVDKWADKLMKSKTQYNGFILATDFSFSDKSDPKLLANAMRSNTSPLFPIKIPDAQINEQYYKKFMKSFRKKVIYKL